MTFLPALKNLWKILVASQFILSGLFIVNFYAVFDNKALDGAQCIALFNSHQIELCYSLRLKGYDYCAIGSDIGDK